MQLIRANLETLADYGTVKQGDIPAILGRIILRRTWLSRRRAPILPLRPSWSCRTSRRPSSSSLSGSVRGGDPRQQYLLPGCFSIVGEIHRPERLLITHWFAPPHIIPLVEVVPGPKTAPEAMDFAVRLMERLGKKTVVLKQFVPSFIVNRIQQMIFFGVLEILKNDWASPEDIDLAVKASLGVRLPVVGAVQTLDFTGLDLVDVMIKNALGQSPSFIADPVAKGPPGGEILEGALRLRRTPGGGDPEEEGQALPGDAGVDGEAGGFEPV
jgi:hypothetical protein